MPITFQPSGVTGQSGFSGSSGYSGFSGTNGSIGLDGASGFSGFSGTGPQGESGFSGLSGIDGQSGFSGAAATEALSFFVPAKCMSSATTNGALYNNIEISAGAPEINSMDFSPTTPQYTLFDSTYLAEWSTGITATFYWTHQDTTVDFGVVWSLEALAVPNGSTIGTAFSNPQQIADTGGVTNTEYVSSYTPTITIQGTPSDNNHVYFRVTRVTGDASDTMAVDAQLLGVLINKAYPA